MTLRHPDAFFAKLREGLLGPKLEPGEVSGANAILDALSAWPLAWAAYGLATAYHETAHTLQPVREHGSDAYFERMYGVSGLRPAVAAQLGNVEPGDGATFCGRGLCQITGRLNFVRADMELALGGTLITHPDIALQPAVAAKVLERGLREGWFTRRRLGDFLPSTGAATRAQFIEARRVVNGADKAPLIADFALRFQDALLLGGWS